MAEITRIGRCSACNRMQVLEGGACSGCQPKFSADLAELARRVRRDKVFARKVFEALPPNYRAVFILWFGAPPPPRRRRP